ncbi:hypothetical protein TREES_T100017948 [Tupaia chinensis]|uniref:Uncharacterized protein n=1 Tax=Tupaia chinensis TaxID=246437 RepID=L9JQH1_TUPCH|nr:hypothetical protein TREES_T100017948 [Tupaia chinensis]
MKRGVVEDRKRLKCRWLSSEAQTWREQAFLGAVSSLTSHPATPLLSWCHDSSPRLSRSLSRSRVSLHTAQNHGDLVRHVREHGLYVCVSDTQ